jgi:CheY-like chemotaxis protein
MDEIFILIAEDDADDRFLLQSAFEENGFSDKLQFVENGVEVIEFLHNLAASGSGGKNATLHPSRPQYAKERWARSA